MSDNAIRLLNDPALRKEVDKDLIGANRDTMKEYSRKIWTYLGHAGSRTAWHDRPEDVLKFPGIRPKVVELLKYLQKHDISLEAYSVFILTVSGVGSFEYGMCFSGKDAQPGYTNKNKVWIKKLRDHAGSSERLDIVAEVLLKFIELQVEAYGVSDVNRRSVFKEYFKSSRWRKAPKDDKLKTKNGNKSYGPKVLEVYHRLMDRVLALDHMKVDPLIWIEQKFWRAHEFMESHDKKVGLNVIINKNGFEPNLKTLKAYAADPWSEIRQFLGLNRDCEFSDGYIPKGWKSASDDRDELSKVVKVTGFGYYFYPDGTQRRGKRHYANNSYFVIKCTPDNFDQFKESWDDPRLISSTPTWEEYSNWAASPGYWGPNGESLTGRGKSVKWRKS